MGAVLFAVSGVTQTNGGRTSFDVASIKVNTDCSWGRGGGGKPLTGRFHVACFTAQDYVQSAYSMFADGVNMNPQMMQVFGGPAWTQSDTYEIEAKAGDNAPIPQMYGPMLQVLLEERFKLKIHKEAREMPVYTLTVAKGGPKLQATKEGSCQVIDLKYTAEPPKPGEQAPVICGSASVRGNNGVTSLTTHGTTMEGLAARSLYTPLDRPVIDRTGLAGRFDIHLEYASADAAVGDTSSPSVFTAVQDQLGLKLTPDKGPVEVLVIDHIERPSEN